MSSVRADDEIVDLFATTPDILEFQLSEAAQDHVYDLIARGKDGTLTEEEKAELDFCVFLEHLMRRVKIRARQRVAARVEAEMQRLANRSDEEKAATRAEVMAHSRPARPLPPGKTLEDVIVGSWPGDETDEEIAAALEDLS